MSKYLRRSWQLPASGREAWRLDRDATTPETRAKPRDEHRDRLRFRRAAFAAYAKARGLDKDSEKKLYADWRGRDRVSGRDEQRGGEHG